MAQQPLLLGEQRLGREARRSLPATASAGRRPSSGRRVRYSCQLPSRSAASACSQAAIVSAPCASVALPRGEQRGRPRRGRMIDRRIGAGRAQHALGRGAGAAGRARARAPRSPAARRRGARAARRGAAGCRAAPASPSPIPLSPSSTASAAERVLERGLAARQHLLLGLAQQIGRGARLDHLEMRHDAGLEREALEQRLAEAVDGHDRQPGRQVEDLREQAARALQLAALAGARPSSVASSLGSRRSRQHREAAEVVLHARRPSRRPRPW